MRRPQSTGSAQNRYQCKSLRSVATSIAIASLVFTTSCEGFFVSPVLTGMAVGPSATIQSGATIQMDAVGTFDDGSQKHLDSGVFWSSDTPTVAIVSTSGLVTGIAPGQATITGAHETVNGSATITVTLGGITSIQVTSADGLSSITFGSSEQFVATATANGQQFDISNSVTWSTNPRSISDISIDASSGLLTTTSGPQTITQFTVVALDPTSGIAGQMNFSVHP